MIMNFATIYSYKPKAGLTFRQPSMTHQEFQDECDINRIMDRYMRTGVLSDPMSMRKPMTYGDFSDLGDYQSNMNKVVEAREVFDRLPAKVRERFGNSPAALLSFVMDENNRDEAISLGILQGKESVTSTPVEASSSTEDGKMSSST